jgi:hypothetical protein
VAEVVDQGMHEGAAGVAPRGAHGLDGFHDRHPGADGLDGVVHGRAQGRRRPPGEDRERAGDGGAGSHGEGEEVDELREAGVDRAPVRSDPAGAEGPPAPQQGGAGECCADRARAGEQGGEDHQHRGAGAAIGGAVGRPAGHTLCGPPDATDRLAQRDGSAADARRADRTGPNRAGAGAERHHDG